MIKQIALACAMLITTAASTQFDPTIPPDGTPPGVTRFYSDPELSVEVGFSVVGCDYVKTDYGSMSAYSTFEPLFCG